MTIDYPPVPPEDIKKATGKVVLLDERTVVYPPQGGLDPRAVDLATKLIVKHHNPSSAQNGRYA